MEKHEQAVAAIVADVRGFYDRNEKFRIYHGSTNSTRKPSYERGRIIDISNLNNVLRVDHYARKALVEPNVSMDRLVEVTAPHGLIPPVVMEFPGITVGGGFAGTAGESSSFKYGLFDCIISQIEIVLANGEVVTASDQERPDLLAGAAGSCGTLGVITMLEIRLIEAAKFVEVTYLPAKRIGDAIQKIKEETTSASIDYLDGIIYSPTLTVVMTGRMIDTCPAHTRIQRFTRASDPWFYQHARDLMARHHGPVTEAVPLVDYLFRYDRGAFWGGQHAFNYFMAPFNRLTRWTLDSFMRTRVMYHAFHESGLGQQTIVQDLALPFSTAHTFIDYINAEFKFFPLWLCPVRPCRQGPQGPHRSFSMGKDISPDDILLNVGVWGMGPKDYDLFVGVNRKMEQKLRDLSGLKCLYAHAYYTEEEFWDIYDLGSYQALRAKYHAESLPTVYDKIKVDFSKHNRKNPSSFERLRNIFWSIWPLSGLYGVYRVMIGGDYLLRGSKR